MTKFKLKVFKRATNELILVFLQFLIIFLHFFQIELLPKEQITQVNPIFYFLGILIIIISSIFILIAIKDLGRNLSPFPKPKANSKLVTTGIYRFMRHPMYYSLIIISFGVFLTKLSIYYLCLTISLALLIKCKIILEEQYLKNKFKNWNFLCNYKNSISNKRLNINLYYKFSNKIPKDLNWYSIYDNKEFIPTFAKKIFKQVENLY